MDNFFINLEIFRFPTVWKVSHINLSWPTTVQCFSNKYFLKKMASKSWDFKPKFPMFELNQMFSNFSTKCHNIRKFRNFCASGPTSVPSFRKIEETFCLTHSSFIIIISTGMYVSLSFRFSIIYYSPRKHVFCLDEADGRLKHSMRKTSWGGGVVKIKLYKSPSKSAVNIPN